MLYTYRTATHSSTGVSPYELMFGRCAHKPSLHENTAHDVTSYQDQLRAKLAQLYDFVELNNVQASTHQKRHFDQSTQPRTFTVGDLVWLSVPTADKLQPKLEGEWVIQSVQSKINDGKRTKTVHINRLRPRLQTGTSTLLVDQLPTPTWEPPSVEHIIDDESTPQPRYSTRIRQPPDCYRP